MQAKNQTLSEQTLAMEWKEIQKAQSNPTHFRPLYDRYYEPIFRYIYRRTNSESSAADLCAQVFLKAINKISTYTFKGVPFSAWLYRIASNEINQHYRALKRNRIVSLENHHFVAMYEEIEEPHNKELLQNALLESLQHLSEKELTLIEMRFFEQRPFKEIADILDMTQSNAKVKTYRTLKKLKKIIQQK